MGIKTHIPGLGCLPSNVLNGILHLCRRGYGYGRCAVKQQRRTKPYRRLIGVIAAYTFVTQLAIRGAQLQMGHPPHVVFKEILFRDNPTGRYRRECCPTIIFVEARRTIVAHIGFEQITIGVSIVYTGKCRTIRVFQRVTTIVASVSRRKVEVRKGCHLKLIATCPEVFVAHVIILKACHARETVQPKVVRVVG